MNTLAYKVEFFDRYLNNYYHLAINNIEIEEDYLSLPNNTIVIPHKDEVSIGDFIRILGSKLEYFGVVVGVTQGDIETTIIYKNFLSIFDAPCLFDTSKQGVESIEETIKSLIIAGWVNNADALTNLPINFNLISSTSYGLNLKPDVEGGHYCLLNSLYNAVFTRALNKYGVTVKAVPNFNLRTIELTIGKAETAPIAIDADLPTVIERNIILFEQKTNVNKLTVWDLASGSGSKTFYLYTDGTYGTDKESERPYPVVEEMKSVTNVEQSTFEAQADQLAKETFGQIDYNNLIEITVAKDDPRVNPIGLTIGQLVTIWTKGRQIESILTGKTIGEAIKLTFGAFRMDLTKIIKEMNNG